MQWQESPIRWPVMRLSYWLHQLLLGYFFKLKDKDLTVDFAQFKNQNLYISQAVRGLAFNMLTQIPLLKKQLLSNYTVTSQIHVNM